MAYPVQPSDSGSSKFGHTSLVDDTGLKFYPPAGENVRTVGGEKVADPTVNLTTSSGAGAALGTAADAKVDTDATGTLLAKARGMVSRLAELVTVTGATADAKVDTDTTGSVSGKLRGVVSRLVELSTVSGATADAAITTNTTGSISGKLRGIVAILADAWVDADNAFRATIGSTGASEDTAAAGAIFPVSILYQSEAAVTELGGAGGSGRTGRARGTARRAVVVAPEYRHIRASSSSVATAGDMQVTTTSITSGYAAPTTAFFDGADAAFTALVRYIFIPLSVSGFSTASIIVSHNLGVNVTVIPYAWLGMNAATNALNAISDGIVIATTGRALMTPYAANGAPSGYYSIPALASACNGIILGITPASDPSSGSLSIWVDRN